mmetsp:Transcript_40666/g.95847  ORF Transcript_40666/g.95847 Transcript_40666/m.95847 type:complete len:353 (-) Transcript_40666:525-1583(-)
MPREAGVGAGETPRRCCVRRRTRLVVELVESVHHCRQRRLQVAELLCEVLRLGRELHESREEELVAEETLHWHDQERLHRVARGADTPVEELLQCWVSPLHLLQLLVALLVVGDVACVVTHQRLGKLLQDLPQTLLALHPHPRLELAEKEIVQVLDVFQLDEHWRHLLQVNSPRLFPRAHLFAHEAEAFAVGLLGLDQFSHHWPPPLRPGPARRRVGDPRDHARNVRRVRALRRGRERRNLDRRSGVPAPEAALHQERDGRARRVSRERVAHHGPHHREAQQLLMHHIPLQRRDCPQRIRVRVVPGFFHQRGWRPARHLVEDLPEGPHVGVRGALEGKAGDEPPRVLWRAVG